MPDALLTVNDLANMLRISPRTAYKWSRRNDFPALKVGGCLRFRSADIEAWLLEQQQPDHDEQEAAVLPDRGGDAA
jgi:excisionase family DNA binding protein